MLADVPSITVTVVPDPYRHWTSLSKSHVELKALTPTYVATNKVGEPMWTDVNSHAVYHGNLHNPMKVVMIGCAGKSGFNGNMVVDPKDARFKHPTGIVIFSSVKKEYAVVADNGNNVLRMISNVSSLRTKKKISTIKIQNLDKDGFKPSILAKHVNTSILVSSTNSKSIYVLLIFPGNATAICLTEVPVPSLTQTRGMAFLPSTKELLIGNEENLLIIKSIRLGNTENEETVITTPHITSYGDVAVSSGCRIAVSDLTGIVAIFVRIKDGFELVEVIGRKPLPGEELPAVEGSSRKTRLDQPLGVAFSGTTSSLYICCFKSLNYKPKKRIPPVLSFHEKMESMIQCSSFLESVNRNRQQALGKEHVSTEQGTLYPNTLVCLSESIKVIREVAVRLQEDGLDTEMLDLHAFMNESAVEHSFAAGV